MGMIGEIDADNEAKGYETVLRAALNTRNKEILSFCKQFIVPLYKDAIDETFGYHTVPKDLEHLIKMTKD